jgi:glutamate-5-semialdehyde dehydrogenase
MFEPKRIVFKIGTSTLTRGSKKLSKPVMLELVRQAVKLHEQGHHIVLVTSGAIAAGRDVLRHPEPDHSMPFKQMLAAVGQVHLIHTWAELFNCYGVVVGQVLLTKNDFSNKQSYLHAQDTLHALLKHRVIPIVNENDTVATDEIKVGDNDNLSAIVANLIAADLLVLLTDQEGLFTADPRHCPDAKLIPFVEEIDPSIYALAGDSKSGLGTGGMVTKLQAAQIATKSGTKTLIASSLVPDVMLKAVAGESLGTLFKTHSPPIESRGHCLLSEKPQTTQVKKMGIEAKQAARYLAAASSQQKNQVLEKIAQGLEDHKNEILAANSLDINAGVSSGLDSAMIERLSLEGRLTGICEDVRKLMSLPDPIGEVFDPSVLPNGLKIAKHRVPIGVLGIIYEARPNVTVDIAVLTIKTGNCAILRGGSETIHSNRALLKIIHEALDDAALPREAIQLIDNTDRALVKELLSMHDTVDLIIPRGGAQLHQFCRSHSTIPVITGGIGICHLFVDEHVDLEKALAVIRNAKIQRPTVCNALDTLLVHKNAAEKFIPMVLETLGRDGVSFRLDVEGNEIADKLSLAQCSFQLADNSKDWDTEWLSLILGIKVVPTFEKAIEHIQSHSSGHSDGILTGNEAHAQRFIREIDSAAVYVNASTRFTDGAQLGLGAEAAISTQKLHARGPMGLRELTSYKWVIEGDYHVRK